MRNVGNKNRIIHMEKNLNAVEHAQPKYLFFDTETTGLPGDYNAPTSCSENWPRLVQLSWIVTDENLDVLAKHDFIIRPEGFVIPDDVICIHGITNEVALEKGVPLRDVANAFLEDFNSVDAIVGHNVEFDKKIMGAELIRLGGNDVMNNKDNLCTMTSSRNYCKLPGKVEGEYKRPRLQELHKFLFGYEFEDAHNSMCDISATLKCFRALREKGVI